MILIQLKILSFTASLYHIYHIFTIIIRHMLADKVFQPPLHTWPTIICHMGTYYRPCKKSDMI